MSSDVRRRFVCHLESVNCFKCIRMVFFMFGRKCWYKCDLEPSGLCVFANSQIMSWVYFRRWKLHSSCQQKDAMQCRSCYETCNWHYHYAFFKSLIMSGICNYLILVMILYYLDMHYLVNWEYIICFYLFYLLVSRDFKFRLASFLFLSDFAHFILVFFNGKIEFLLSDSYKQP